MCNWSIVPQEYKEELVEVKPVSHFPIEEADGTTGFGRLNSTYLRIFFNADNPINAGEHWKLTMSAKNGKVNLTPPRRLMPATQIADAHYVPSDYMGSSRKSSGQMTPESMIREMTSNNFPEDFAKSCMLKLEVAKAIVIEQAAIAADNKAAKKAAKAEREAKKAAKLADKAAATRIREAKKAERTSEKEAVVTLREAKKAAKVAEKEAATIAERARVQNPFIPNRKALGLEESDPIARAKAEGMALMLANQAEEAKVNKPMKASTSKKKSVKKKKKTKKAA